MLSHLPVPGAQPGNDCGQARGLIRRPLAVQQRLTLVLPLVLGQAPGSGSPGSQALSHLIPLRSTGASLKPDTSQAHSLRHRASLCKACSLHQGFHKLGESGADDSVSGMRPLACLDSTRSMLKHAANCKRNAGM